jgi:hypothetical protein
MRGVAAVACEQGRRVAACLRRSIRESSASHRYREDSMSMVFDECLVHLEPVPPTVVSHVPGGYGQRQIVVMEDEDLRCARHGGYANLNPREEQWQLSVGWGDLRGARCGSGDRIVWSEAHRPQLLAQSCSPWQSACLRCTTQRARHFASR